MRIDIFDTNLEKFIHRLEASTLAKVFRTLDLLEEFGHNLGMPHSRKVSTRIFELRIRGVQEVRIFYTFHRDVIILLHGFIKKSQRIPAHELDVAQKRLQALDEI